MAVNRVTIAGLAQQLGMSKASVSYALNGQPGVSEQTRQKVLSLAAELGWYPSSSARALSHARTDVIGIVLSREPELIGAEPYYMSLLAGVESVLGERDMSLLLRMVGGGGGDLKVYQRWAGERRVDGVIIFDHAINDQRLEMLRRLQLPAVLHGASQAHPDFACTIVDQAADAKTLVEELRRLGHHRIAQVSGPQSLVHEGARRAAVLAFAVQAGMEVLQVESDYTLDGGSVATEALTSGPLRPTAIIYGNDLMAMGGILELRAKKILVPDDVSVLSWDDSILCRLGSPAVTALQRDPEEQGRNSARLLLDVIAGRRWENSASAPGRLRIRDSTGPASGQ